MFELSLVARVETAVTVSVANIPGDAAALEIQYATRRDFQFCIAPVLDAGMNNPIGIGGLNRQQNYFFRVRGRRANGTRYGWGPAIAVATLIGIGNPDPGAGIAILPAMIVVPEPVSSWAALNTMPGYPVTNLGLFSPQAAWRSVVNGGGWGFTMEMSGNPYDTIAILETNLAEDCQLRIKAGASQAEAEGVNPPFSYGPLPFRASPNLSGRRGYHGIAVLPVPIAFRFLRVDIVGTAPAGLAHITHALAGLARSTKNYSDLTEQWTDGGSIERLRDGTTDTVSGFRGRRVDFEISMMTETQYETRFADLGQRVGGTDPVLVITNPKAGFYVHDRILYGPLVGGRVTSQNMRYTRSFSVDSIVN